MGIIGRIFKKKEPTPQMGKILVTPQEASQLSNKQLDVRQGSNIQIVGETSKTTSGGSVGGGSYSTTTGGVTTTISPTGKVTTTGRGGTSSLSTSLLSTPTPTTSLTTSIRNVQGQAELRKTQEQLRSKLMEQLSKPTTTQLEKGSGKLRDYQFEQQTKRDLERYTQKETKKYQDLVNQGMDVDVANEELNQKLSNYQKSLYQQEGYSVAETSEGLSLSRNVPSNQTILQYDIFGRTKIVPTTYEEAKETIPKSLFLEKASATQPPKDINESEYFRPIKYLGEQIEKSKVGQKLIEKYPFIKTGEIYGSFKPTYQNPFKIEPTTESIKYLKPEGFLFGGSLNVQKGNIFMSDLGKWVLFAPLMATEVSQIPKLASKPTEETLGIVTIERGKGAISDVRVLSKTGKEVSISSEKVLTEGDVFLGGGKGFRGQDKKIFEFQQFGAGKELPSASLVKEKPVIDLTKSKVYNPITGKMEPQYISKLKTKEVEEIGTGVLSKGYQRDTGRIIEETKVYNPFTQKMESKIKYVGKAETKVYSLFGNENYGLSLVVEKGNKPSTWVKQDILGTIHPIEGQEGVFKFLGTTKPIVRIYKKGGVSYIIKKPDIKLDIFVVGAEPEAVQVAKAGIVKKTPFAKTFPQLTELEKQSILSQIQVSKVTQEVVKPTRLNILGGVSAMQVQDTTPLMVGGQGLTTIPYSGTGQYETTETTGLIFPSKVKTTQLELFRDRTKFVQQVKPIEKTFEREEQKFIQPIKEIQKEVLKENQRQKFLQLQSEKQTQRERQIQKQIQQQKQVPVIITIKPTGSKKDKEAEELFEGESLFEVFGRRFGKFSEIGKAKSEKEAKDILEKFLSGTLGASGKIKKDKEFLRFSDLNMSSEFRMGKRDEDLVVQLRKYRLKRGDPQVREIQMFQKNKSKKLSFFR